MANIEVEVRGELTKDSYNKVISELNKKAEYVKDKERLTIAYYRGKIPKDVRETSNEEVDLRVRVTGRNAEIILKHGLWGAKDNRTEIPVPIALEDFDNSVELLRLIGWNNCLIATALTKVFNYKGIEFAIVIQNNKHYYFEAEKITSNKDNASEIHKEIEKACQEFGLKPHTQEGFYDFINKMNEDVLICDFNQDSWKEIKKKYKEFF